MRPFKIVRAESPEEAYEQYAAAGDTAAFYAGGTEILLVMKEGFAEYDVLIDIKHIDQLSGIGRTDSGGVRIGAATSHRALEKSEALKGSHPLIPYVERDLANVRVRNAGTIGGNLCFGEPHSDIGLVSLLCEAEMGVIGPEGARSVPATEFFKGAYETAVEPGELLTHIDIPELGDHTFGYQRFRFHERPSCAAGAILFRSDDGSRCERAIVGAGAAGPIPHRSAKAEELLAGQPWDRVAELAKEAGNVVAEESDPLEDLTGSVDYKRHLVGVFVKRAIMMAVAQRESGGK